jgi:hypothetical protein
MSPKKVQTRATQPGEGRGRRQVAEKYLEVANLIDSEDGTAINVCVGVAVLAGIAAADAICSAAIGERSSGSDHDMAVEVLSRVDAKLGKQLRDLVTLKNTSHYGFDLLTPTQRKTALRCAAALVAEARLRLP